MTKIALPMLALLSLTARVSAEDFFDMVSKSTPELVQNAISGGARVDDRDKYGRTPLMFAARYNTNAAVLMVLLEAGAQVNERDKGNRTPLMFAAAGNQASFCLTRNRSDMMLWCSSPPIYFSSRMI